MKKTSPSLAVKARSFICGARTTAGLTSPEISSSSAAALLAGSAPTSPPLHLLPQTSSPSLTSPLRFFRHSQLHSPAHAPSRPSRGRPCRPLTVPRSLGGARDLPCIPACLERGLRTLTGTPGLLATMGPTAQYQTDSASAQMRQAPRARDAGVPSGSEGSHVPGPLGLLVPLLPPVDILPTFQGPAGPPAPL